MWFYIEIWSQYIDITIETERLPGLLCPSLPHLQVDEFQKKYWRSYKPELCVLLAFHELLILVCTPDFAVC